MLSWCQLWRNLWHRRLWKPAVVLMRTKLAYGDSMFSVYKIQIALLPWQFGNSIAITSHSSLQIWQNIFYHSLKTKSCQGANFVAMGGTVCCHSDNPNEEKICHYDNFRFSVLLLSLSTRPLEKKRFFTDFVLQSIVVSNTEPWHRDHNSKDIKPPAPPQINYTTSS